MNTTWLDILSGLDKMVVGSILGAVVLAFVLIVVVFSIKIKSQQERIADLEEALQERHNKVKLLEEHRVQFERREADSQTVLEHFQATQQRLEDEADTLKAERDAARETLKGLEQKNIKLDEARQAAEHADKQAHDALAAAHDETQAVLKRNEFWVEQLSELRTKHEALKLKIRAMERERS